MTKEPSTLSANYTALVAYIASIVPEITSLVAEGVDWRKYRYLLKDPTLEDVLRTVHPNKIFVSTHGALCLWDEKEKALKAFAMWHLGKPLSEQSDELKSFLHSLLPTL